MGTWVIRCLQHLAEQGHLPAASRTRLEQIYGYFDRHSDHIHDEVPHRRYPVASGVIEGTCRHARLYANIPIQPPSTRPHLVA